MEDRFVIPFAFTAGLCENACEIVNRFWLIPQLIVDLAVLSIRPKMPSVYLIEQYTEQITLVIADMLGVLHRFDSTTVKCI